MTDPLETICDLLMKEHGIKRAKLNLSTRLLHDLRVDGDDAEELFASLYDCFGTDFSALSDHWSEFFNPEFVPFQSMLPPFGFAMIVAGATIVAFPLSPPLAGVIGMAAFIVSLAIWGLLFPGKPKRPVTIEGLAAIVRAGAWPADPSAVH